MPLYARYAGVLENQSLSRSTYGDVMRVDVTSTAVQHTRIVVELSCTACSSSPCSRVQLAFEAGGSTGLSFWLSPPVMKKKYIIIEATAMLMVMETAAMIQQARAQRLLRCSRRQFVESLAFVLPRLPLPLSQSGSALESVALRRSAMSQSSSPAWAEVRG